MLVGFFPCRGVRVFQPIFQKCFLFRREDLSDLVGTALQGLQKPNLFNRVERGGPDVDVGIGRGFIVFSLPWSQTEIYLSMVKPELSSAGSVS